MESIPGKLGGGRVLMNTRMPVQTVFDNLEAGMSVQEITETFDVSADEIKRSDYLPGAESNRPSTSTRPKTAVDKRSLVTDSGSGIDRTGRFV